MHAQIELVSTILTIGCLWLGIKQHITNWPLGIAITLMDLVIYHHGALYDRWLSAAITILFSLYGWYQWSYGLAQHERVKKIVHTSFTEWLIIIALGIVLIILLVLFLNRLGSALPYHGACSVLLMIIGLWMTAHKKLETYAIWSVYNLLAIYVNYVKGYYWFSSKYFIALVASMYGYYEWRSIYLSIPQERLPI